jgi:cystathionine beta-lyase
MKIDTLLVHRGRHPEENHGIVNPPVYHASTVTFPSVAAYEASAKKPFDGVHYGRTGTPTTFALEEAITALHGGYRTVSMPSGLAAIANTMFALLKKGDHALLADNVYGPTRFRVADPLLARAGVEVTFFDPLKGIGGLIRPETKVVYLESPGSLTFEMLDVRKAAAEAKAAGATVVIDNTWASPLYFRPIEHGVDVVIEAGTKYIGGHADVMLGTVTVATPELHQQIKWTTNALGSCAGPDDCYLGLRGLRTLSVRLERHQRNALELARWLQQRPEVDRVLYPALSEDPGHALWKRDFDGASGLFGVVLKQKYSKQAVDALLNGMTLFGLGDSWGGYESLLIPTYPGKIRTAKKWHGPGPTLRVHAGLEDPKDLIADLEKGLQRLNAAA